jgi:hypothetical protein
LGGDTWTDSSSLSLRDFAKEKDARPEVLLQNAQVVVSAVFGAGYTAGMFKGFWEAAKLPQVEAAISDDFVIEEFEVAFRNLWSILATQHTQDMEDKRPLKMGGWHRVWAQLVTAIVIDPQAQMLWREGAMAKQRQRTIDYPRGARDASPARENPNKRGRRERQGGEGVSQPSQRESKAPRRTDSRQAEPQRKAARDQLSESAARSSRGGNGRICIRHLAHSLGVQDGRDTAGECERGEACRFDHQWQRRSRSEVIEQVEGSKAVFLMERPAVGVALLAAVRASDAFAA